MTAPRSRDGGFTLVELTVALVLMAAIAAVLFGSLSLAARTWDGGEAKAHEVSDMRAAQAYLRSQISAQYPQRMWRAEELPLMFGGEREEMRYTAALPERVAEGGVYYSITVSETAEADHRAHGDGRIGELVPERISQTFDAYCRPSGPDVDIETFINGEDAETLPGLVAFAGIAALALRRPRNRRRG